MALGREDVRACLFAQHEEHQYIEQTQQVNVDAEDPFVLFVSLILSIPFRTELIHCARVSLVFAKPLRKPVARALCSRVLSGLSDVLRHLH